MRSRTIPDTRSCVALLSGVMARPAVAWPVSCRRTASVVTMYLSIIVRRQVDVAALFAGYWVGVTERATHKAMGLRVRVA